MRYTYKITASRRSGKKDHRRAVITVEAKSVDAARKHARSRAQAVFPRRRITVRPYDREAQPMK